MTDSRLSRLERAWEASGSAIDEAAYLRERVRTGDLSRDRLDLAAYCGNQGARAARDEGPEVEGAVSPLRPAPQERVAHMRSCWSTWRHKLPPDLERLLVWLCGLRNIHKTATAQACCAIARHSLSTQGYPEGIGALELRLRAAEQWCQDPTLANATRAHEIRHSSWEVSPYPGDSRYETYTFVSTTAAQIAVDSHEFDERLRERVTEPEEDLRINVEHLLRLVTFELGDVAENLRQVAVRALLAWALQRT